VIKFVSWPSYRILRPMAEEKIQGDLPQSHQDNSIKFPTTKKTIQDLRTQNATLAAEKLRLQQEYVNLKALLSAHTEKKDCHLYHQEQSSRAPESGTTMKDQSDQKESRHSDLKRVGEDGER
jgi:hypothetical protein